MEVDRSSRSFSTPSSSCFLSRRGDPTVPRSGAVFPKGSNPIEFLVGVSSVNTWNVEWPLGGRLEVASRLMARTDLLISS